MAHDLFEDITTPTIGVRGRSPYAVMGSIAAHVAVIAALVIVPLMAVGELPAPLQRRLVHTPVVPAPPPAARPRPPAPGPRPPIIAATASANDVVPVEAPDGLHDAAGSATSAMRNIGDIGGSRDGVTAAVGEAVAGPAAPAVPAAPSGPQHVGGQIREPQKVFSVSPVYPAIARAARISGIVVIEAVIDVDGQVRETRIKTSVPLLDHSALDAVRQWRYRPTLLNGVPVPVIMTVSVRFTLE